MAIIGKTGGTGTRSFARANAGYTVPFGATGVTSGTAGVNGFYLLRSHNLNKQIVLNFSPNAWNYVAPVSTTGGVITHPEDSAGVVKGWIGSTGAFWFQPNAGKTAGAPFGAEFIGGQPALPGVAMGPGVTTIRISRTPYLSSLPYQGNGEFAIFNRKTLIKAYVQDNPVRVFFYTNGTATWNNTDQYWQIPVVHATGSITAGQPGFKPVFFEFPAQIPLDETEGNNSVRTWAGPNEFQTLYIAHSVPATGGMFDPQQPNNQTQPLRPTIGPGTYGPDAPLGGVGFWGIKEYTEGPDTYIGRDLITKHEAFVQLANNCYIYTNGTYGTFSTPDQVIDWMDDWGFWSNYAGPQCAPDNLP